MSSILHALKFVLIGHDGININSIDDNLPVDIESQEECILDAEDDVVIPIERDYSHGDFMEMILNSYC